MAMDTFTELFTTRLPQAAQEALGGRPRCDSRVQSVVVCYQILICPDAGVAHIVGGAPVAAGSFTVQVLASPGPSVTEGGNPYIRLLYGSVSEEATAGSDVVISEFTRRMLLQQPDVIHVNWPYYLVRWDRLARAVGDVAKVLILLVVARRRGAALVWTVHDLRPHDIARPRLWRLFINRFVRQVDMLILLSGGSRDQIVELYPQLARTRFRVVPHGHYRGEYASPPSRHEARRELGLPDVPTLLAFGQIRAYKRTVELCQAFVERPTEPRTQLLVAGDAQAPNIRERLQRQVDPRIHLRLGVVPNEQVPVVFGACDVVVLPYSQESALNSSVALLALSFDRPVVMVDSAAGRDLQALLGSEWVTLTGDDVDDVVAAAEARARSVPLGSPDLSRLDWPRLGADLASAYRDAVAAR